jgi:undecaprenyl pyrophosphate phosphatase UppP
MKKFTKKEFLTVMAKHAVCGAVVVVVFYFLSKMFGSICPTYRFLGICCPFCGMTRAHLAAMRLDFSTATYYNPVFYLGVPCVFFMLHEKLFAPKYNLHRKIIAGVLLGIICAVYVARVCTEGFDFFD